MIKENRSGLIDLGRNPIGLALHQLSLEGALCCRSELRAPWSIEMPTIDGGLMFHIVVKGSCLLQAEGEEDIELLPGHFTLVSDQCGHTLSSEEGIDSVELFSIPAEQVSERFEIIRHGGKGKETILFCGVARLVHPIASQLLRSLPKFIHLNGWNDVQGELISSALRLMSHEAQELRAGSDTVITRLCDILVIQALRAWIEEEGSKSRGWIGALRDPQVGLAISRIHAEPGRDWSVASLAEEVALSRSGFSARFKETLGIGPMDYVTRWRMTYATTSLRNPDRSLFDVAASCGYASEAAFSRAFKRSTGISPGGVRRGDQPTLPPLFEG